MKRFQSQPQLTRALIKTTALLLEVLRLPALPNREPRFGSNERGNSFGGKKLGWDIGRIGKIPPVKM